MHALARPPRCHAPPSLHSFLVSSESGPVRLGSVLRSFTYIYCRMCGMLQSRMHRISSCSSGEWQLRLPNLRLPTPQCQHGCLAAAGCICICIILGHLLVCRQACLVKSWRFAFALCGTLGLHCSTGGSIFAPLGCIALFLFDLGGPWRSI